MKAFFCLFLCLSFLLPAIVVDAEMMESGQIYFADDFTAESLLGAVNESISYYQNLPVSRRIQVCGNYYSPVFLGKSLVTFTSLIKADLAKPEFNRQLQDKFTICRAKGGSQAGRILVTGYYEPLYEASLKRGAPFLYPLYKVPADLAVMVGGSKFSGKKVGRLSNTGFVPYWTRAEIEKNNLLAGHELVYLKSPIDVFIMQVQGSGRVRLRNGVERRVQFAAKSGRKYRSIGRLLVDEGRMNLADVNMASIITYLQDNPDQIRRILNHNQSYVFFRWGQAGSAAPLGCLGRPLTSGRSVALDRKIYPAAGLAFLVSERPEITDNSEISAWAPMTRFVLNQDSGSAIKGGGRLDFFYGTGEYAEAAAGFMKQPGELYFLVQKK